MALPTDGSCRPGDPEIVIAPSLLAADFGMLDRAIDAVAAEADWLHLDVMDGHFVPNLTIGPPVVESLRGHTEMFFDCHLMITNPAELLGAFADAGANGCTVHVEIPGTAGLIAQMRDLGLQAGLALNPETPFELVEPFLGEIDLLLVMTVHPGFGGQSFMGSEIGKVALASKWATEAGSGLIIEVDGGIDATTAKVAASAGATAFVAGSAIFGDPDPATAARKVRDSVAAEVPARR